MRTTVTLDRDVARLMREARSSFKQTLNTAERTGLAGKPLQPKATRFVVKARPLGLRAGIGPASLNKLVDERDVDEFLVKNKGRTKG